MPGIDSQVFSYALTGFLIFGAANLTIELIIAFVLSFKKLKATILTPFDLESGKLRPVRPINNDDGRKLNAALLSQIMTLSSADRQVVRSILETLNALQLEASGNASTNDLEVKPHEDLGMLRFSRREFRVDSLN